MKLKIQPAPERDEDIDAEESDASESAREPKSKKTDSELERLYDEGQLKIVSQKNDFLLPQLINLIMKDQVINLRPEYQRRLRWDNKKKSQLIESVLMNAPIPPIFLFESDLARYEVMDGQQRLNAILEFFNNELSLTGLGVWPDLNGKRYRECPPRIQRGFERRTISAVVLLNESEMTGVKREIDVRQYVFERLNTGGEKLNPQEIRNCIFSGSLNGLIVQLARHDLFARILGMPPYSEHESDNWYVDPRRKDNTLFKTMGDCQMILRFLALRNDAEIRGSMRAILDGFMKKNLNPTDERLAEMRVSFETSLKLAHDIFGSAAFRLPQHQNSPGKISRPLFDAIMVSLDSLTKHQTKLRAQRARLKTTFEKALLNPKEYEILIGRPNTAQSVKDRISHAKSIFSKVI